MGSTLLTIGAIVGGLFVLAGLLWLVANQLRLFRPEKVTEQMRAIPAPPPGSVTFARTAAATQEAIDRGEPRLRETSAPAWAARVIVLNTPLVRIGRSLNNEIVLPEDPVSAEHCRLERHEATFRLIDLGSTNKTWVNGREIEDVVLKHGDELRVGPTTFVFERGEPKA